MTIPPPLVSIVIPVYNGSNYLRHAIESALAQTYAPVEIVVVNDGSNDGGKTDEIARSFLPRIRYITKDNGGVATALNRGIAEANGAYLSWLSHDDVLHPDKLSRQIAVVTGERLTRTLVFGDFSVHAVETNLRYTQRMPWGCRGDRQGLAALTLLLTARLHGCTLLIPRACFAEVGPFSEHLRTTQDYDLWFRLFAAGYRFRYVPGVVLTARLHPEQGTRVMSDIHRGEVMALYGRALVDLRPFLGRLPPWFAYRITRSLRVRGLHGAADVFLAQWATETRARALGAWLLTALAMPPSA